MSRPSKPLPSVAEVDRILAIAPEPTFSAQPPLPQAGGAYVLIDGALHPEPEPTPVDAADAARQTTV